MAKLTKKQYTRKRLFTGVTVFISVALITTGVAVWMLFSDLRSDSGGGIDVAKVAVSPLSFLDLKLNNETVEEGKVTDVNFVFDSLYGDDAGRVRWDGGNSESLSVTVSGRLMNAQQLSKFQYTLNLPQGVIDAAKKGYVDVSAFYDVQTDTVKEVEVPYGSENITVSEDGITSVLTFNFTVELGWGEFFNYTNPSIYYDTEYYDSDGAVDYTRGIHIPADEMMQSLEDFFATVKMGETSLPQYTITLIAKVN